MVQRNTIHHMSAFDLASMLHPESLDMVLTDPPYGINYKSNHKTMNNGRKERYTQASWGDDTALVLDWIAPAVKAMKPNSCMYHFCHWSKMHIIADALEQAGLQVKMPIIWDALHFGQGDTKSYGNQMDVILFAVKGKPTMRWHKRRGNVVPLTKLDAINNEGNYDNRDQKPENLLKIFIQDATRIGDLVFDPFCGSGSTAAAAKKLGRDYIVGDISEYQIAVAKERLQQPVTKLMFA